MKKLAILAILVLSLSFTFAQTNYDDNYVFKEKISETKYYPHENRAVTTTTYIDYENDNRYPTYDYRHGYTYRATTEYRDSYKKTYDNRYVKDYEYDRHEKNYHYERYDRNYDDYRKYRYDYDYNDWDSGKVYYFEKSPYSNNLIEKSCYTYKPNKLFYIKC